MNKLINAKELIWEAVNFLLFARLLILLRNIFLVCIPHKHDEHSPDGWPWRRPSLEPKARFPSQGAGSDRSPHQALGYLLCGPRSSSSSNSKSKDCVRLWVNPSGSDLAGEGPGFPSPKPLVRRLLSPLTPTLFSSTDRLDVQGLPSLMLFPSIRYSQASKPQL